MCAMSMTDTERITSPTLFELLDEPFPDSYELPFAEEAAQVAHDLGSMAMRFARVERVPRYDERSRENDAEHSFMLALVATELAATNYSDLDPGLVTQFSTVHDLVELETADEATYLLDDAELAAKAMTEHDALERVASQLPPFTRQLFLRYEAQLEAEARFVRMVDKILPVIVNIMGAGSKIMREDYAVTSYEQFMGCEQRLINKLRERFPDAQLEFLHQLRDVLSARFAEQMSIEMT
jgi:5'-deoxynucleotidase YfbR-like HD superfamily hydrolase